MDPTASRRPDDDHPTASSAPAAPIPDADPDLRIDPHLFPDYRLLRSLGRGGMGEVFLARNVRLDRYEAIKVIHAEYVTHPGAAERFQREVRNAAQYQDQHIVTVYGYLQAGDVVGFAMEHVPGQTLSDVVKAKGPLAVPLACHYARQVALGLQRAHEKGMVHRDIKPGNLILRKDGPKHLVKILDFGLSKVADAPADSDLTGTGRAMGTPAYAAPEQAADAAAADTRSDIYALGGTLFYLLTGRPPFAGRSAMELWVAHAQTPPPSVTDLRPDVPAELAAVVARMLAKNPADRFQTPAEVAAALVPFIKAGDKGSAGAMAVPDLPADRRSADTAPGTDPATIRPGDGPPPARPRRRGPMLVWIAPGLVLAMLVGLGAGGVFRGKTGEPAGAGKDGPKADGAPPPARIDGLAPDGFTPLFNGVDTAGWTQVGPKRATWKVEDGVLSGRGDKLAKGTILATERDTYADFELEVRAMHADYHPAAVYVRHKVTAAGVRGYRIALGGFEGKDKGKRGVAAGSVRRETEFDKDTPGKYDLLAPKRLIQRTEWFTLRVTVRGNRVTTAVDGEPAQTFEDKQGPLPPGQIAVWLSGDTAMQFKSIAVRELR